MAGLEQTDIGSDMQRTKDSATVVVGTAKVFLLGVVDLEKEKAKLLKESGKLEGQIGGVERKLSNEGFLAKAPPAVVEKERGQLAAMKAQLEAIKQSLSEL
jgi:valyl-tRNA synthetase